MAQIALRTPYVVTKVSEGVNINNKIMTATITVNPRIWVIIVVLHLFSPKGTELLGR